jgi:hypothetical protein
MGSHATVLNETTGYTMKLRNAKQGIKNFALGWVEVGVSVKKLNWQEQMQAQAEANALREYVTEPLPAHEPHHLKFEHPGGNADRLREKTLVMDAEQFAWRTAQAHDPVRACTA